jgi:hypothetical protein
METMELKRKILFYGNSIIQGTMAASLREYPQFEVTVLLAPETGKPGLEKLNPDVIFFDLEAEYPDAAFSLLESNPDLLLIGISPDKNLVKTGTGQELHELSMQDLLKVINDQVFSGGR